MKYDSMQKVLDQICNDLEKNFNDKLLGKNKWVDTRKKPINYGFSSTVPRSQIINNYSEPDAALNTKNGENAMINPKKLDFWIDKNYNVLFSGKHGIGKTAMVVEAFKKNNLNWKYFSAATMDPWVDFVGVPREVKDEDGTPYLDLLRPREFEDDEVQAIFIDEFNRAHKKVKNACMELIQFKSINGRKFKNLKIVWAAVNPHDDSDHTYDVEPIDPAQLDRFHVHVTIPYKLNMSYLADRFGINTSKAAAEWWNALNSDNKKVVTPRRLDYALQVFKDGGDVNDVLPRSSSPAALKKALSSGPFMDRMEEVLALANEQTKYEFFAQHENLRHAKSLIKKDDKDMRRILQYLPSEEISRIMKSKRSALNFMISNASKQPFRNILESISVSGLVDRDVKRAINSALISASGINSDSAINAKMSFYGHEVLRTAESSTKALGLSQERKSFIKNLSRMKSSDIDTLSRSDLDKIIDALAYTFSRTNRATYNMLLNANKDKYINLFQSMKSRMMDLGIDFDRSIKSKSGIIDYARKCGPFKGILKNVYSGTI